jgi:hypothetical protein
LASYHASFSRGVNQLKKALLFFVFAAIASAQISPNLWKRVPGGVAPMSPSDTVQIGTTVQTVADAASLTAALASSIHVILMAPGTYAVPNGIVVPSGYTLHGAGADQTILNVTGAGKDCITFTGSNSRVDGLTCQNNTGTRHGLVFDATAAMIQFNSVSDVKLGGVVNANAGVYMHAVDGTHQVSFNSLSNLNIIDYADSVKMDTGGATGPTDNVFYGGQWRKTSLGGTAINGVSAADNKFYGLQFSGHATAISGTVFSNNHLLGLTMEANTADVNFAAGSINNNFAAVTGNGTYTDAGTNNYVLASNTNWTNARFVAVLGVGGKLTLQAANPLLLTDGTKAYNANIGSGILSGSVRDLYWTNSGASGGYAWYVQNPSSVQTFGMGLDRNSTLSIGGGGSATKIVCWKADGKTLGYATMAAGDISACN